MAEHGQGHITAASAHLAAASALANRIKSFVPKIYDIMKTCKDKVAGLMQPAVDEIVALRHKKNILGRHCGIHPKHRGLDPLSAQKLGP